MRDHAILDPIGPSGENKTVSEHGIRDAVRGRAAAAEDTGGT